MSKVVLENTSIQDFNTGEVIEITTKPNGDPITVTIHCNDGKKITDKESVWNHLKENGFSNEQIAGLYGDLTLKNFNDEKEEVYENKN